MTVLVAGLAGPAALRAQQFRPGWVLPLQGDTLRGELEDNQWDEEPVAVRLRTGPAAVPTTYAAATLQAFGVRGGQYFRRETLPFDRTARTQLDQLPVGLHVQQQPESVLAEVLVSGPAELLHLTWRRAQHYFVRRPGKPFVEVTERKYLQLRDGRQFMADGNNYRAVLEQYFGDCLPAAQLALRASFTQAGLTAIVQEFNRQCSGVGQPGPETTARPVTRRFATHLGVLAGMRYASFRLHGSAADAPLTGLDLDGRLHPVGGAYLDVLMPSRRIAFHTALLLGTFGHDGTVPEADGASLDLQTRQTIGELRLGARWLWPAGPGNLLLGTGLAFALRPQVTAADYTYTTHGTRWEGGVESTYPLSFLPYLEAGLRRGRLTALAEGRLSFGDFDDTYLISPNVYGTYHYRVLPFYVGLCLEAALLRQH